jgi:hypothetical protein
LTEGKYLKPNSGKRSIGTIRAKIAEIDLADYRISFYDESGKFYPRRKITDLAFIAYADNFTGSDPRALWAANDGVLKKFRGSDDVFIRVGLTRPWKNPEGIEGCWLQVTGIYSFPDYSKDVDFAGFQPQKPSAVEESKAEENISGESKTYSVEEIRKKHSRAYEKWTEEEDSSMVDGLKRGLGVEELACRLGRQPSAIRARMEKLQKSPGK